MYMYMIVYVFIYIYTHIHVLFMCLFVHVCIPLRICFNRYKTFWHLSFDNIGFIIHYMPMNNDDFDPRVLVVNGMHFHICFVRSP